MVDIQTESDPTPMSPSLSRPNAVCVKKCLFHVYCALQRMCAGSRSDLVRIPTAMANIGPSSDGSGDGSGDSGVTGVDGPEIGCSCHPYDY